MIENVTKELEKAVPYWWKIADGRQWGAKAWYHKNWMKPCAEANAKLHADQDRRDVVATLFFRADQ